MAGIRRDNMVEWYWLVIVALVCACAGWMFCAMCSNDYEEDRKGGPRNV